MTTHHAAWHVPEDDLSRYSSGSTSPVLSTSIETHLMSCAGCRDRMAAAAGQREVEEAWEQLADRIDRPSPGVLGRFGAGHRLVRSTIATPTMVAAALAAVGLVVLVPLVAAAVAEDAALMALLVVAPLAPVAAVGLAYREWADPAGEISLATPSAGLRLVTMRAMVVSLGALVVAAVALLLVGAWVDLAAPMVFSWCLPGLALSAVVMLAGTSRLDPLRVATLLSLSWAAAVVTGSLMGRRLRPEAVLEVIASPALQSAALTVALVALFLTVARRDTVSYRRTA